MKSLRSLWVALALAVTFLAGGGSVALAQTDNLPPAPTNLMAVNGANPGEVNLTWNAAPEAAFYRIGWVAFPDYEATIADGRNWLEAFHFFDAENTGQTQWTLTRLSPGVQYYFIIGSASGRFQTAQWSEWSNPLTLTQAPTDQADYSAQYPNCDAVQEHFPGGVKRGSPIYRASLDPDGDGIACEPGSNRGTTASATIESSSTSASATLQLQLIVESLPINAESGSAIELYLEDDFQVPNFIPEGTVHFSASNPFTTDTNNGGSVAAAGVIAIREGDHYGGVDDWAIRAFIPDMSTSLDGYQGPMRGQTLTLTFTHAAGIRNPSEEGIHSIGYSILSPDDEANGGPQRQLGTVPTYAKISLSDEDNVRGYELTVAGSGFNNGTSAAVYVLHDPNISEVPSGDAEALLCTRILREGQRAGIATVGSDDKVAVTFEVTVPTFMPGKNNYICMVDGEGRSSHTDVERFHLEPTMRVVPGAAYAGDTVNVFVQDFPNPGAVFTELRIAGQVVWPQSAAGYNSIGAITHSPIGTDGSATASFDLPGSISGVPLGGNTVRIDVKWGDVSANGKITVIQ